MLRKYSEFFLSLFFVSELLVLSFAWIFSYFLRFHVQLFFPPPNPVPLSIYLWYLIPLLAFWSISARMFNLYRPRRISRGVHEIRDVTNAVTITLIFVVCFIYATRRFEFSRLAYLYFWIGGISAITLERACVRRVLRNFRKRGYNLRFALVIGSGRLAEKLLHAISNHPELGVMVKGILTFKREEMNKSIGGVPIMGFIDDLEEVVDRTKLDIVFVALPLEAHDHLRKVLKTLMGRMLDIKIIPDVYEYIALKGGLDRIDDIPLVGLQTSPLFGWNMVIKRAFDLIFATFASVILSPVFASIAFLIKMTSKGTVFYVQERLSMDGRAFSMYKFRTMQMDVEKGGPVWAKEKDPRRTKIGAFLRRFNLDELPQLINVLKGEMSIVGPRPERPYFVKKFKNQISQYMLRHRIKAGMTGWAQINGFRGSSSLEKRIEYDIFYIKNWSIWFDLRIIVATLWRGFKNAY
ncbi:MAG: undecaprenyl-phosphate glucose phosphotransferase [Candidatus Aenigmarchaeota archaeon]|nr:undecaprenyl-phosphate glucose phosphotransferase [Candidatus Aenigmarchaeota archaeon]